MGAHDQGGGRARGMTDVTRTLARYIVELALRRYSRRREARGGARARELGRLRDRQFAPRDGGKRAGGNRGVFWSAAGRHPRPPRTSRHPARGADQRHQLARARFRRHARTRRAPERAGSACDTGACRAPPYQRRRFRACVRAGGRSRMPRRALSVPRALRPRLAYHRHRGRIRRGGGGRQTPETERAANGVGARHRGHAIRGTARNVRLDVQEFPSRDTPRTTDLPRRCLRRKILRAPSAPSKRRAAGRTCCRRNSTPP